MGSPISGRGVEFNLKGGATDINSGYKKKVLIPQGSDIRTPSDFMRLLGYSNWHDNTPLWHKYVLPFVHDAVYRYMYSVILTNVQCHIHVHGKNPTDVTEIEQCP